MNCICINDVGYVLLCLMPLKKVINLINVQAEHKPN